MSPVRVRLVSFLYTCAAISLAAGSFASLSGATLTLMRWIIAASSLVASVVLAILAGRFDEWTHEQR